MLKYLYWYKEVVFVKDFSSVRKACTVRAETEHQACNVNLKPTHDVQCSLGSLLTPLFEKREASPPGVSPNLTLSLEDHVTEK